MHITTSRTFPDSIKLLGRSEIRMQESAVQRLHFYIGNNVIQMRKISKKVLCYFYASALCKKKEPSSIPNLKHIHAASAV